MSNSFNYVNITLILNYVRKQISNEYKCKMIHYRQADFFLEDEFKSRVSPNIFHHINEKKNYILFRSCRKVI